MTLGMAVELTMVVATFGFGALAIRRWASSGSG